MRENTIECAKISFVRSFFLRILRICAKKKRGYVYGCDETKYTHTHTQTQKNQKVGTGNRATMAIRVLLDHYVCEKNIYFVCFVCSKLGITNIARLYPKIHV